MPSPRLDARQPVGFTLIELLVVVTIIVILLALLTPALDRALKLANDTRCAANLHPVGTAMAMYLQDHKSTYPRVAWYSQLFGEDPRFDDGAERGGFQGSSGGGRDVNDRPLNRYLGYEGRGTRVPIAECPLDQGDFWSNSARHCFTEYGTSYIEATIFDPARPSWFRIKAVFGSIWANTTSSKLIQLKRTSNKVLVVDWPVYGDRRWDDPRSQWHSDNVRGKQLNTLFADYHVEMFTYDNDYNDDRIPPPDGYANNWDAPANSSFRWW